MNSEINSQTPVLTLSDSPTRFPD